MSHRKKHPERTAAPRARLRRVIALALALAAALSLGGAGTARAPEEVSAGGAVGSVLLAPAFADLHGERQQLSRTLFAATGYDADGREVFCGQTGHTHSESCYTIERRVICGQNECAEHHHTEECWSDRTTVVCGMEERAAHTHTDACYAEQSRLVCTDSSEEHVHTEDCYVSERVLACSLEEREGHSHTAECFLTERVLSCGKEETEGHTHSDACWEEERILTCGLGEHVHTLECYSDRSAVETDADWRASVSGALITGRWDLDLIAVARTQIGYRESSRNYIVRDGVKHGYTRYGDWIDSSESVIYGAWCASFASFCVYYANIKGVPYSSNCAAWIRKLIDAGMYYDYGEIEPRAGDLMFLYSGREKDAAERRATHVGIVAEIRENSIVTIEGNVGPVCWREYELDKTDQILGFARLPDNPDYRSVEDPSGLVRVSGVLPENVTVSVRRLEESEWEVCLGDDECALCGFEIGLFVNGEEYRSRTALEVEIRTGTLQGENLRVVHFKLDDQGTMVEYWPVEQLELEEGSLSYLAFRLSRSAVICDPAAQPGKEEPDIVAKLNISEK